jgi:hypothetical protein
MLDAFFPGKKLQVRFRSSKSFKVLVPWTDSKGGLRISFIEQDIQFLSFIVKLVIKL